MTEYYNSGNLPRDLYVGITHNQLTIHAFPDSNSAMYWLSTQSKDGHKKRLWKITTGDATELRYVKPDAYLEPITDEGTGSRAAPFATDPADRS